MAFLPFNEPIPIDYFADGRKLTGRGKGPVQDRRDSLVDFLNDLREKAIFGGYRVDPDDPNKFDTVNEAYDAADLELPAGFPVHIVVALTKDHILDGGALSVNGTRSLFITVPVDEAPKDNKSWKTKITGNITLSAADSASDRLTLGLKGFILEGNINGNSNWEINLNNLFLQDGIINRIHGTNDCWVFGINFQSSGGDFKIIDADVGVGKVEFYESSISFGFESNIAFKFLGAVGVTFRNCYLDCFSLADDTIFDFNGAAGSLLLINTCIFPFVNATLKLADNASASSITWAGSKVGVSSSGTFDLGAWSFVAGVVTVIAESEPSNPPNGSKWEDLTLKDFMIWDGTYWGNGSIFRKNLLVDVDTAAVSHSSGWTVPTGAGVINISANALKALTAGGGATLYGISDGSDGDKFAESAALIQNSKASAKQASINVGSGDTIYVHSMTASGTEGGTLAGSNDKDVRVVVYFTMPKTLPDV